MKSSMMIVIACLGLAFCGSSSQQINIGGNGQFTYVSSKGGSALV
jgi:ABC-type uncharacterized transport system permease subunit